MSTSAWRYLSDAIFNAHRAAPRFVLGVQDQVIVLKTGAEAAASRACRSPSLSQIGKQIMDYRGLATDSSTRVKVLNVAGQRPSKEPVVGEFVMRTLDKAFS